MKASASQSSTQPASWTVPHWWIDGANTTGCASDSNSCTSATCGATGVGPCLSVLGGVQSRWGTNSPYLAQATTITLLSSMANADPFFVNPIFLTNGALTVQGTPTQTGTFTLTSVTAKNRAAAAPARINVSGHAWTAGTLVHDTTAHASFWIDSDLGSGTAQITEPFAYPVALIPSLQAIAGGDTIVTLSLPSISMKFAGYTGIAQDAYEGGIFLTDLLLTAEAGPGGAIPLATVSTSAGLAECATSTTVTVETAQQVVGNAAPIVDSYVPVNPSNSTLDGSWEVIGGSINGTQILSGGSILDGDVLVHGNIAPTNTVPLTIGCAYFDSDWWGNPGLVGLLGLSRVLVEATFFDVALWGPAAINLVSGEQIYFAGTTATAALLNTGALTLDSSSGFPWVSGSHAWGAAVSVTPANIDSNHGLWNPQTGSAFHF